MVMLHLTEETCHWLATAAQNGPKWPLPRELDYWTTQESPQLTLPGPNFATSEKHCGQPKFHFSGHCLAPTECESLCGNENRNSIVLFCLSYPYHGIYILKREMNTNLTRPTSLKQGIKVTTRVTIYPGFPGTPQSMCCPDIIN